MFHMRCTRKIYLITMSRVKESIRDGEYLEESKLALTQLSSQLATFTSSLEKRRWMCDEPPKQKIHVPGMGNIYFELP
jgi:hypothetical protein